MRVAATAIILDQDPKHENLKALFESTDAAGTTDYFLGLDDKSIEGTEEFIKGFLGDRAMVVPFTFDDDFSKARQVVTALVQRYKEIEWFYWIDSDDTLEMKGSKNLPGFLATVPPEVNSIWATYLYEEDEYGNPSTTLVRRRFLRNSTGWFWKNRVHEDIFEHNEVAHGEIAQTPDFLWHHHSEGREPTDRNFRILAKAIAEDPDDPRNYYYLGNQHFAARHWPRAVENYEKYVSMSNWTEEKWCALIYAAIGYRAMGMLSDSLGADMRAMQLKPDWADSYFGMGEAYARMQKWEQSKHWGELGLQMITEGRGIPDPIIFVNQNAYMHNPYQWLAVTYANLGQNDMALSALKMAYKARPEKGTKVKIDHLEWAMERDKAISAGLSLAVALIKRNEPLKAQQVLASLPAGAAEQQPLVAAAERSVKNKLAFLDNKTSYKNFYWSEQKETMDPVEELKHMHAYPRIQWVLRTLQRAGVKRILEFGVGNALSSLYYASNGIEVVGLDVDPQRVSDANLNALKLKMLKPMFVKKTKMYAPMITKGSKVQFHYAPAEDWFKQIVQLSDGTKVNLPDLGPFDAVVATEIIEHVPDPSSLLEACEKASNRVILSTPDGAFSGPQIINPSHIRMYSQRELTGLLAPRGRLWSMHHVAHPNIQDQGNIVAEYIRGATYDGPNAIIYCYNTGQGWTPDSIRDGGIGGSETAVVRVAEELAKKGVLVHVYAECEGIWNGVRYSRVEDFRPYPAKLFVSWRGLGPIAHMKDLAQHRWVWAHDVHIGKADAEELKGVKVIALTDWHKEHLLEQYPTADVIVIGNGLDKERFEKPILCEPCKAGLETVGRKKAGPCAKCGGAVRKLHRIIYAQSPDRGLDKILEWWPEIKEKYLDAELRVFYGMDMARRVRPHFIQRIEDRAQSCPGVFIKGRIGQDELAEEYRRAGVTLMPELTPEGEQFPETFNISLLEAQAAGVLPIVVNYAGNKETGKYAVQVTEADAIKDIFLGPYSALGQEAIDWAKKQTWESIADRWLVQLRDDDADYNSGRPVTVEADVADNAGGQEAGVRDYSSDRYPD